MSGRITIDGLSTSLREYINNLGLTEEQVQQLITAFENEKNRRCKNFNYRK